MDKSTAVQVQTIRSPFAPVTTGQDSGPQGVMAQSAVAREVSEVQSALVIAKQFPRDERRCMDRILNACTRPSLAEAALYQYSRGGTDITGPSIRLAEAIAQAWGNLQCGVRELERRAGESTCEAFAWDIESNTKFTRTFAIPHVRQTKKGSYRLEDDRDIYEMVANQGARRLRACILETIPGDVIDAAVKQCDLTLATNESVTPESIQAMLDAFREFSVSKEQIERRIQRRIESMTPAQKAALRKVYVSLKDQMSTPGDWFEAVTPAGAPVTAAEAPKTGTAGLKAAVAAATAAPAVTAAEPAAPAPQQQAHITPEPTKKTVRKVPTAPPPPPEPEPDAPVEEAAGTPFETAAEPEVATGKPPATNGPSAASLSSMGHTPPLNRPNMSKGFDEALAVANVPRDMVERYLRETKQVAADKGLSEAPASVKLALMRDPKAFGRAVSDWVDKRQSA